jgi:hypothetical protein
LASTAQGVKLGPAQPQPNWQGRLPPACPQAGRVPGTARAKKWDAPCKNEPMQPMQPIQGAPGAHAAALWRGPLISVLFALGLVVRARCAFCSRPVRKNIVKRWGTVRMPPFAVAAVRQA